VITRIHPEGGEQDRTVGGRNVVAINSVVGEADAVSVCVGVAVGVSVWKNGIVVKVGVGKFGGKVGGICVGVAGEGRFSANDR
jgi:hypothetical protein